MNSLQPVLALLERGRQERFHWRDARRLAAVIQRDLERIPARRAASYVTALVRLAIAMHDLASPTAHDTLLTILEHEPLVPKQLRTGDELRAARAVAAAPGLVDPIDRSPGRPREDRVVHQRRWTGLERRRALRRSR